MPPIKVAAVGRPFPEGGQRALIECMVLIYDNSNPIMGSLLSVARTAAFNYGQPRIPRHRGPCLPASTLPSLRKFGGPTEGCLQRGGRAPWPHGAGIRAVPGAIAATHRMCGVGCWIAMRGCNCAGPGISVRPA